MSSALLGNQRPRVEHVPRFEWTEADDAAFLASSYGMPPDDWQLHVLTGWLGRRPDGRWSAGRCGLAVPRQNGKNGVIELRELYGMVVLGEKFLHTAHQVKTARKAFLRLLHFFGDCVNDANAKFPELNALVVEIRKANGQEAIVLANGGSVEIVARSKSSGRGFTVDVLILDEAQDLTDDDIEALQPTISAAPLGNPQTILTGTPPPPNSPVGLVWTRTREAGVKGTSRRLCWHEWSITGQVDVFDRKWWAATNPSLGGRLHQTVVEDELPPSMSVDGFMRERLGKWWDPEETTGVFPGTSWRDRFDADSRPHGPRVFSVDVAPDSSVAAIASVSERDDELLHGQVVAFHEGVGWVVDRVEELVTRWGQHGPVVLCGRSAAAFKDELERRKIETHVLTAGEMIAACLEVNAAVIGTPAHLDEDDEGNPVDVPEMPPRLRYPTPGREALDDAVRSATRKGAVGGWYWAQAKGGAPITPLVALTGAVWGATRIPDDNYDVLQSVW